MKPKIWLRRALRSQRNGSISSRSSSTSTNMSASDHSASGYFSKSMRRCSNHDDNTCPLCLDIMQPSDIAHSILCPSPHCHFNFCSDCVERLYLQQEQQQHHQNHDSDDYNNTANNKHHNDNNKAFHCPNCRSDIKHTIYDTLLLRKVDRIRYSDCNESESEESLILKKALGEDELLLHEIANARDREAQFWKEKNNTTTNFGDDNKIQVQKQEVRVEGEDDHQDKNTEEWGIEVDLRVGTHESIKLPWSTSAKRRNNNGNYESSSYQYSSVDEWSLTNIDRSLLAGLEDAMSSIEQEMVTRLLTQGDVSKLVQATKIQADVIYRLRNAGTIFGRQQPAGASTTTTITNASRSSSSVYEIIQQGRRVRSTRLFDADANKKPTFTRSYGSDMHHSPMLSRYVKTATIKAAKHQQVKREARQKLAFLRAYPIPIRMPKLVQFEINFPTSPKYLNTSQIVKSLPVRFCNDTWDGTITDCFSKTSIWHGKPSSGINTGITSTFVNNYTVTRYKQDPDNHGIQRILDAGHDRIEPPHPRVLIASIVQQPQNQGIISIIQPGDVVTHLNDIEVRDSYTVDDLIAMICSLCYVNAEEQQQATTTNDDNAGDSNSNYTVKLQFALNADRAVAEALRLRAQVIKQHCALQYD